MTNTNAVVSDNAIAQTTMQSEECDMTEDTQEMLTASMADAITQVFDSTFQQLIAIRDSAYADAIEALERESEALAKEHAQLQTAIHDIEASLPAKTRLTQHEVDVLLVSGKPDAKQDVKAKMDELKELQSKPALLRQQQKECIARSEAIASEKRGVAKQVFETWYTKKYNPLLGYSSVACSLPCLRGYPKASTSFRIVWACLRGQPHQTVTTPRSPHWPNRRWTIRRVGCRSQVVWLMSIGTMHYGMRNMSPKLEVRD